MKERKRREKKTKNTVISTRNVNVGGIATTTMWSCHAHESALRERTFVGRKHPERLKLQQKMSNAMEMCHLVFSLAAVLLQPKTIRLLHYLCGHFNSPIKTTGIFQCFSFVASVARKTVRLSVRFCRCCRRESVSHFNLARSVEHVHNWKIQINFVSLFSFGFVICFSEIVVHCDIKKKWSFSLRFFRFRSTWSTVNYGLCECANNWNEKMEI